MKTLIGVVCVFLTIGSYATVLGQESVLDQTITFRPYPNIVTQKDHLDFLSSTYGVSFSYNATSIIDDKIIKLGAYDGDLETFVRKIFSNIDIKITLSPPNKLILIPILPIQATKYKIIGYVRDSLDHEAISGALIYESRSNAAVVTNENGYFIMLLPAGEAIISIQYLGYKNQRILLSVKENTSLTAELTSNATIPEIIIDAKSRLNLNTSGEIIEVHNNRNVFSITGEKDPIISARTVPGVQSGGEGQSGLYVRGGSQDQNLILLEGIALYEFSHTAGISSIFIDETINNASLIKNGFPARYGGRLSSVLDVQLKQGDKLRHNRSVSLGIPGARLHFNGPFKNPKTTYNIAAKTSLLNFYINKVLTPYTKFDDINVRFQDFVGKISHQFNNHTNISLTAYIGGDNLSLSKKDSLSISPQNYVKSYDRNSLSWNNQLISLKASKIINDKVIIKAQTGFLRYNNTSRSSYKFETVSADSSKIDELDVISISNIDDFNTRIDIDYYYSPEHTIRFGANYINHRFNPTIKQSKLILDNRPLEFIDKDSIYIAHETNFYVEDNFKLSTKLLIYFGVHSSLYKIKEDNSRFSTLQPRLNIIWSPFKRHILTGAYSRMAQFSHLLSNTGLGLPSSLWVPSTANVAPEQSTQLSLKYDINISSSIFASIAGFDKKFENILEFTRPIELFYFLINDQAIVPFFNTSRDWQRNVVSGVGTSKGIEFSIQKKAGDTQGWVSTTYSKTIRTFRDLNKGRPYPAPHDRTWDINCGISQVLGRGWTLGSQFVFGSGRYFTLAAEEYNSFYGIQLLNVESRNNYRLPSFHQLSINASHLHIGKTFNRRFDINIYNVYNRLNAYYIYIYRNNDAKIDVGKKVSILPITPTMSFTVIF